MPWLVDVASASPSCVRGYLSAAAVTLGEPGQLVAAWCRRSAEAPQSPRWVRIRAFQKQPWLDILR